MKSKSSLDLFGAHENDNSMTCVVSTCASSADVCIGGKDVHQFTLSLVAPLGPEDNGYYPVLENVVREGSATDLPLINSVR